ncbi:MAG: hypothetical protein AUI36_02875 [Cyanobacteria bacterium 13_1_40CM_2_61_4]|nr:MAG: hypothetical protein AUI36_02875 [Cyanobacteria bacterium 13_1_40CM_2_61_4]
MFLFAAKFIEKKRPCDFVQSVCRAASENPRIAGLMVGDGPLRQQCESLNEAQHGSVRFAGFLNQSEIAKAYVAADALVLPSDGDETWGLVVNEAMFCGLPCVVSDKVGSGPDLVLPETGDVFQLGNVDQLTRILAALAQDTTGLASMGCRARTLIQQRYSPSNAVDGILTAMCAIGARNNLPVDPAYQNNQS